MTGAKPRVVAVAVAANDIAIRRFDAFRPNHVAGAHAIPSSRFSSGIHAPASVSSRIELPARTALVQRVFRSTSLQHQLEPPSKPRVLESVAACLAIDPALDLGAIRSVAGPPRDCVRSAFLPDVEPSQYQNRCLTRDHNRFYGLNELCGNFVPIV